MLHSNAAARWAVAALVVVGTSAHAAHPLQTEDTGTQGQGNLEFENGFSWVRAAGSSGFGYQPQLSYGLSPVVDLIVQPSWAVQHAQGGTVRGRGDTNLDTKWRFFGAAPWSLAVRAGATLATSQHDLGLPAGTLGTHALLSATVDAVPFTAHANLGVTHDPGGSRLRAWVAAASGAVMWAVDERLTLTVDARAGADPDPTRNTWLGSGLAGAIFTVRPGLDIDIGWQGSLHAAVAARAWLVGVTYRFAP